MKIHRKYGPVAHLKFGPSHVVQIFNVKVRERPEMVTGNGNRKWSPEMGSEEVGQKMWVRRGSGKLSEEVGQKKSGSEEVGQKKWVKGSRSRKRSEEMLRLTL